MAKPRERLRARRGGGRVVWGGDACVALVLPLCTRSSSSQGDASVPSPLPNLSRPYECDDLPPKNLPV